MKNISNILKYTALSAMVFLYSCNSMELDLTENPNGLNPSQANPDFFLNAVQEDFARTIVESFGLTGAQVTRISYMNGRDYANAYGPTAFDGRWQVAYQGIMQDLKIMNDLADGNGLPHHVGMGQVMQAYIMMTLVDFFGDVPYSESLQGTANLNPDQDAGADVYAAAIALLDAAIANFAEDALAEPQYDFFYGGDWDQWTRLANTLKMKAYMTTRLTDAGALAAFDAIVSGGNYIQSNNDDFEFPWGTNEIQPDTRHPAYAASYTATGGGRYQSNSLMNYMLGNNKTSTIYDSPDHFDPRMLFYFYRQVDATPGIGGEPADEETLECGLQTAPTHYAGYAFCGVELGYWGRDHGNDNGIPPDGFLRVLAGVYPAGGRLDDLSYQATGQGGGNGGAGVTPVMLNSWVHFMRAERAMVANDEATAKTHVMNGISEHIDKVINFASTTETFDWKFGTGTIPLGQPNAGDPGPVYMLLDDYVTAFEADVDADWDAADTDGRWELLSRQYFVAMFGNGIDAYNFYRRTGYPHGLQPNIEPSPGNFIRSFFYPANYANTNSNVTQKDNVNVQVFWDNNAASPAFPQAN